MFHESCIRARELRSVSKQTCIIRGKGVGYNLNNKDLTLMKHPVSLKQISSYSLRPNRGLLVDGNESKHKCINSFMDELQRLNQS